MKKMKDMGERMMYTYENLQEDVRMLSGRYPNWLTLDSLGGTLDGRALFHLLIGKGRAQKRLLIHGGIHGREYMTSQLVMKQTEAFLNHIVCKDVYKGCGYRELMEETAIHVVPMANPDGVSISQNGLAGISSKQVRARIEYIAELDGQKPQGNYLLRWKANANGVDLNRNFDACWGEYQDPVGHPSADHFKGSYPGSETESAALIALTREAGFDRTISYHAQGSVIYWNFGQRAQLYEESLAFAKRISHLTGYPLDGAYGKLDAAGYKDWAILGEKIPSLTIEIGRGETPVPPEQFIEIWRRNEFVWEETLLDIKRL